MINDLSKDQKIKLITHHWGANWNKGFDSYVIVDNLIAEKKWKDKKDRRL